MTSRQRNDVMPKALPTFTSLVEAGPEISDRVRRLIYQATYTGMKETDVLLGHFAKTHLPSLSENELDDFEALLGAGDTTIYAWVMGIEPVPVAFDTTVFHLIKKFNNDK
jgi:antitoxin CptB